MQVGVRKGLRLRNVPESPDAAGVERSSTARLSSPTYLCSFFSQDVITLLCDLSLAVSFQSQTPVTTTVTDRSSAEGKRDP